MNNHDLTLNMALVTMYKLRIILHFPKLTCWYSQSARLISIVAVHAVSLERAGPFTALEDFGVGHSQEEQNQQTPHDGIFPCPNVSTTAAASLFIAKNA